MNPRATIPACCATALLLLFLPTGADALSCAMRHFTLSDAYEEADAIVIGMVTECAHARSANRWAGGGDGCALVTLEVLKPSSPARDYAGVADSAACGLSLQVGHRYLLFLDKDNQPLWYSEPLHGNTAVVRQTEERVAVLRDYRDGVTADVSEPWFFAKHSVPGTCTLMHSVRGHRLTFSRRAPDATPIDQVDWSSISVDGKPLLTPEQISNLQRQIRESKAAPAPSEPMLLVFFNERLPGPPRDATLRVGNQSWSLERRGVPERQRRSDTQGEATLKYYRYYIRGAAVDEILGAMADPSDITVTATLTAATTSAAPTYPDTANESGPIRLEPAPPTSVRPTSSRYSYEPPPVVQFETRSTNLRRSVDRYRACLSAGGE